MKNIKHFKIKPAEPLLLKNEIFVKTNLML